MFVTFTVTFNVTFYPVTRTVIPIVTLNCNGKYTVTPTVTVFIVKNNLVKVTVKVTPKVTVKVTVKVTLDVTVRVMRFIICNDASNAYKIL